MSTYVTIIKGYISMSIVIYTLCKKRQSPKFFQIPDWKWCNRTPAVTIPVLHNILPYVCAWLFSNFHLLQLFMPDTINVLCCWNWDTSESISEIPVIFWNVVLEKDGEDQLDRSCEKRGSHVQSQEGQECPIYNKKEGRLIWLVTSCLGTFF